MFKKQLLILFIVLSAHHSSCFIGLLIDIVEGTWKIIEIINEAKTAYDTGSAFLSIFRHAKDRDAAFAEALGVINNKLDDLKAYTTNQHEYIGLLIEQLPKEIDINTKKDRIVPFVVTTDRLWNNFISLTTLESTENMVNDSANEILQNINADLGLFRYTLTLSDTVPLPETGLFMSIIDNAHKKRDILCDQGETSHYTVIRLFHIAILTEIKAYILLYFANILKYSKQDAWTIPLKREFVKQIDRYIDVLLKALIAVRLPYIRSCEQKHWQRGDNFYELEGYLQQTIYVESRGCRFRRGASQGPFSACEAWSQGITDQNFYGEYCFIRPLNLHTMCIRTPINCMELDRPRQEKIIVRPWNEGPHRIRCMKHNDRIYGTEKTDSCAPGDDGYTSGHTTSTIACSCQCSESKLKIMMDLINSRLHDNYIIVGLRIHRVKYYIYIQIAEGKLEANGQVSNHSWVPSTRRIYPEWGYNYPVHKGYQDKYVFFLEDLQVAPGHALIGIQFSRLYRNNVIGFGISIMGMKFDYKNGTLEKRQRFLETGNSNVLGTELKVPGKNPINKTANEHMQPNSRAQTHLYLRRSDLDDDYGQSTLPFFDGIPIMTRPLSPIGGVGLFYKGYTNHAGLLSLRLFPINYTYYLETYKKSNNFSSLLNLDDSVHV